MASITTWRVLGLSVAVGYAGLGTAAIVNPYWAAHGLFGFNKPASLPVDDPVPPAIQLLGARDLSIAAALFIFDYYGKHESMGQLILSCTILCAADVYKAWTGHSPGQGLLLGAGASIWTFIGYSLANGKGDW